MLAGMLMSLVAGSGATSLDAVWSRLDATTRATTLQVRLDGEDQALQFEQFEVLEEGVIPMVASLAGQRPADLGGLTLWRVSGSGIERGFIGVSSWGVAGFVESQAGMHIISSGSWAQTRGDVTAVHTGNLPPTLFELPPCEVRTAPGWVPPMPTRGGGQDQPCRVASLAIDTDWEFTERIFKGNADAGSAYAVTLAGAISEIYTIELNVRLGVSFLRTWSEDVDPYDPDSSVDMLDQFRNHWTASMGDVERTIAHMLTGRTNLPYGGVAWLSVLCSHSFGYGVSGYLAGTFPQPIQHNHSGNWDLLVMAHELGHNFGTLHTHDGFNPPLDNCGNGDCEGAENGTIMSYCHICPGGVENIELGFRDEVREVILGYMEQIEGGCDLDAGAAAAIDDDVWTLIGEARDIDVLANDAAATCDDSEVAIDTYDELSVEGGVVTLVPGGAGGNDQLNYAPPVEFVGIDTFMYSIPSGEQATVTIDVVDLREPDSHGELQDGLKVQYYALSNPQWLPDFDSLDPYLSGVLVQVNFPSTDGAFAGSGRSDEVGAVCSALIDVPMDGLYTFYTESDEGSKLFIGNYEVVYNDGIHTMEERSGQIGLAAGRHKVRVEFFENMEGAGLIVRWAGPNLAKQIVPASHWVHEIIDGGCPEDVDGSGTVDVDDLLSVISAFGPCDGCDEDFDGDGQVSVNEILAILSLWDQDC